MAPTCAALALTYNLCALNVEGFPFAFSSSCFPSPHPCPLSATARTGHSGRPPRPLSPPWPPPELTSTPRPSSRRPPPLLRPATYGYIPPDACPRGAPLARELPTLRPINWASLRHSCPSTPPRPVRIASSPKSASTAVVRHDPSAPPLFHFGAESRAELAWPMWPEGNSIPYLFPLILI
jgi:hypothetical protein